MPDIITQLKTLKLHGMADCYVELRNQGASGVKPHPKLSTHQRPIFSTFSVF